MSELLTRTEERTLLIRAKSGDRSAQQELVFRNAGLVRTEAHRLLNTAGSLEFDDLCQEGSLGLLHAIDRFDLSQPVKLSTYAVPWIRQFIGRAIDDKGRMIRIPPGRMALVRTRYRECQETGKEATAEEMGAAADVDPGLLAPIVSLNLIVGESGDTELEAFIGDDGFEEGLVQSLYVSELLERLTPKHRRVIECLYGLNGHHRETLAEIGREMGLCRERIRQIEREALRKLRFSLGMDAGPYGKPEPYQKPKPKKVWPGEMEEGCESLPPNE